MTDFETNWKNINWKNVDKEKAEFIFEQGKDHLEKILYASDQIENKAFITLGFSFTLLNGLIAYIVTQFCNMGFLLVPSSVYVIVLFVVNILLLLSLKPTNYEMTGSPPEKILKNDILEQSIQNLIMGQVKTYSIRISNNLTANKEKLRFLNIAVLLLVCSPIVISIFTYFKYLF